MNLNMNIKTLEKLVGMVSISSNVSECKRTLEVFRRMSVEMGLTVKVGDINEHPYLIIGDVQAAEVLFLSHLDVVEASDNMWKLRIKGDQLFGRGVLDMKGPTLAAFEAFKNMPKNKLSKIVFVITTDEEVGGFNGTKQLVGLFKSIKLAFVLDGGSGEKIVVNQKAPLHVKVTHEGVSAHASRPEMGINSLETLAGCCLDLTSNINNSALTILNGGEAINKIPGNAEAVLDIRLKDNKELSETREKLIKITAKHNCGFEELDEPLFFRADRNNSFIKKFQEIRRTGWAEENGTSDGRFLWHNLRIPVIMTSVIGEGAHGENEWASASSLNKLTNDISQFINNL